jgi:hypothetical protein
MIFGQVFNLSQLNVNVVTYLLNINSWKDKPKEFKKKLKDKKKLDDKRYCNSSRKAMRMNNYTQ